MFERDKRLPYFSREKPQKMIWKEMAAYLVLQPRFKTLHF